MGTASALRKSSPVIAAVAIIVFVIIPYLFWRGTWFGTPLTDEQISEHLAEREKPRNVQKALSQILQKMERKDASARRWYPDLIGLVEHPVKEVRITLSWVLAEDNADPSFHEALRRLLRDGEPMVRRNAALSLVRFGDRSGREELVAVLQPFIVRSDRAGPLTLLVAEGGECKNGQALARVGSRDNDLIRGPIDGTVIRVHARSGDPIRTGQDLLTLSSNEAQVWEALRALYLIGKPADASAIAPFSGPDYPERIRRQAQNTLERLKQEGEIKQ